MGVSLSLNSIARSFLAPAGENMADYGANHFNDTGKVFVYLITLGFAKLYEYVNSESITNKKNELVDVAAAVKKKLDFFKSNGGYPKSMRISCMMQGRIRELIFIQTKLGSIHMRFADGESKKIVLKKINFAGIHQKLCELSSPIPLDESSDTEIELRRSQEIPRFGMEFNRRIQTEKEAIGKIYDTRLSHAENIMAALLVKKLPLSHEFVLEDYVFDLGRGIELTLPKNITVDCSCKVTSGTVKFYSGRLVGVGRGAVVIAAGEDAVAVSEKGALSIAAVTGAAANAEAHSFSKAIAAGSDAYANGVGAVATAVVEDSKSHATHFDALAIAAADKSSSCVTARGGLGEAAAAGARTQAMVAGAFVKATRAGATALVHKGASGEATVPGATVKAVGDQASISGVDGAKVIGYSPCTFKIETRIAI